MDKHIATLEELAVGVELDAAYDPAAQRKLEAIRAAIALMRGQSEAVAWLVRCRRTGRVVWSDPSRSTAEGYARQIAHRMPDNTLDTEVIPLHTHPQDASGDAEDAAMFRWLCDNAKPWESVDNEQPHALIRICRGEFQGGVGWFNIIGSESRVGVITLRDAVRAAMQAKEAK